MVYRVTRAVAAAVVRWDGAIQARRDLEAYSRLSDRTLKDVGISRSEIHSIAHYGGRDSSRRYRGR